MLESIIKYAPTIATIMFFTIFCIILFTVLRRENKKKFAKYSRIPLDDEKIKTDDEKIKTK